MIYQLLALFVAITSLTASESTNEHANLCKQLMRDITNYDKDFSNEDLKRYSDSGIDITNNDFCKKPLLTYYLGHRSLQNKLAKEEKRRNHILQRVTALLNHGANPNHVTSITHHYPNLINCRSITETSTPLTEATKSTISDSLLIELLIQHGADTNICDTDGYSPLLLACYAKKPNVTHIQTLISHKANVNLNKVFDSITASFNHNCLEALIAGIGNRQENGKNSSCSIKAIRCIFKSEFSIVNIQDSNGNTALHHAVKTLDYPFITLRLLLRYGADPHIQNNKNEYFAKGISVNDINVDPNMIKEIRQEHFDCARKHLMAQWIENRKSYWPFMVFKRGIHDNYEEYIATEGNKTTPGSTDICLNKHTPYLHPIFIKRIFSYVCPLYPKIKALDYKKELEKKP